ncbi:hypothetical protein BKA82DRAFT_2247922 [Pisolithus tinctorius]|nr:hypothetical protein BKA82DRAFT_2247922 [Pisolithus tinctorius]
MRFLTSCRRGSPRQWSFLAWLLIHGTMTLRHSAPPHTRNPPIWILDRLVPLSRALQAAYNSPCIGLNLSSPLKTKVPLSIHVSSSLLRLPSTEMKVFP